MSDPTGPNFYLVSFSDKPNIIYVVGKDGYKSLMNKLEMNYSKDIILKMEGEPDESIFEIINYPHPPPPPPPPGGDAVRIRIVGIPLNTIVNDDVLPTIADQVLRLLTRLDANTQVDQVSIDKIVHLLQAYFKDKKGGKKISLRRRSSFSRRRRSTKRRTASRKQQKRRRGSRRAH